MMRFMLMSLKLHDAMASFCCVCRTLRLAWVLCLLSCCVLGCDDTAEFPIVARAQVELMHAGSGTTCRRSISCVIETIDWNAMWSADTCHVRVTIDLPTSCGGTLTLDGMLVDVLAELESHGVSDAVSRVRGRDWRIRVSDTTSGAIELTCEGGMMARLALH